MYPVYPSLVGALVGARVDVPDVGARVDADVGARVDAPVVGARVGPPDVGARVGATVVAAHTMSAEAKLGYPMSSIA